ncbi:hypothetical protein [Lusitaniella coriacea]|uniref:hypothetical protein n=1 Tax=Lusitaniella coriacea TaxID=1983105 RepID=UPI003CF2E0A9
MNFNKKLEFSRESGGVESLPQLWAKKYVKGLVDPDTAWRDRAKMGRGAIADKLLECLRGTSAQAWSKTETVLDKEVQRHDIEHNLINPWQIAKDVFSVYEQALAAYAQNIPPRRLSVIVGSELGEIRNKHTAVDPRVIGFVSMQFHYTGELLLEPLLPEEQIVVSDYFKVIDDHLYMPLQRAYNAAAEYDYDSPILEAVRNLLPQITNIATKICQEAIEIYPGYQCYSGPLNDPRVQISSRRDIEMFQVYLCVCALEANISIVKQELFPLCVMLYPALEIKWELIQMLINLIGIEVQRNLGLQQTQVFKPYLQAMADMFSPAVFSEKVLEVVQAV